MKFDLIISNPPYNRGLDLKILKNVYNLSDRICFIHPATWLYDNKNKYKLFVSIKKLIKEHFISATKVENANKIFGIRLFVDTLITYINKNKVGLNNEIYNIDIHGNSKNYKSLKSKILNYTKENNLEKNRLSINNKKYEVGFSVIRGHSNNIDFYTFLQKTNKNMHIGKSTNYNIKFGFNTLNEALNFKNYLKTKITRFALSIYKINQNLDNSELVAVPYMPTYKHEWADEMVAKELNLTDEELRWAINWIPNYYEEDKEKYKKYKD